LINKLLERYEELQKVELVSITSFGDIDFGNSKYKDSFYINSLFVSANTRSAVNSAQGDYVPIFLSEIPRLFYENYLPLDVAIVQVSPPDASGFCSLGTSIDIAKAATDTAKVIIAQVNPNMPRVHGNGFIHVSKIDKMVWHDEPLPEVDYSKDVTPATEQIGRNVAALVEDGATLQLGIGAIPDLVLRNLTNHKNLGIHTEMFSDGALPLIESGVINNSMKNIKRGRIVTSFMAGTKNCINL